MPGAHPFDLRSPEGASPCPAMILPPEVHEKGARLDELRELCRKKPMFSGRSGQVPRPPRPPDRVDPAPPAARRRPKLTLPAPGPIPAAHPMESLE